jgi:8-oxo-dGTP pyrophosphatase MutT (NUDIX family)
MRIDPYKIGPYKIAPYKVDPFTIDPAKADPPAKFSQPSRTRKERQQVAAVCYRIRKSGIQFLLVQTRAGRWIFPKGGAEPALTYAQSAALEAFEEAGVHGRIEAIPFARYLRRKPENGEQSGLAVIAYLCEVSRLEKPQEQNRTPTWFPPEKAKQRLLEQRSREFGAELGRVVDRALLRIQRLHSAVRNTMHPAHREGLREVRFEGNLHNELGNDLASAVFARHFLHHRTYPQARAATNGELRLQLRRILPIGGPAGIRRPLLRLGSGTNPAVEAPRNITAIDSRTRGAIAKSGNSPANKRQRSDKN